MKTDYTEVTEVAGDDVSREQIERMCSRYTFATNFCKGKEVLEIACGSGQGLGQLAKSARLIVGGDYSSPLIKSAQSYYQGRIPLLQLDAHFLPFRESSFDVIILYEAIYYLEEPEKFVKETGKVLRPGGKLILCNANKDLPDFNPSPHSYRYFSAPEFVELLKPFGFEVECFGDCEVNSGSSKQRVLSFLKKTMVRLNLMPKTMAGKKFFKRIVFGKLVPLPPELTSDNPTCSLPCSVDSSTPDLSHKVIFAVAQKKG